MTWISGRNQLPGRACCTRPYESPSGTTLITVNGRPNQVGHDGVPGIVNCRPPLGGVGLNARGYAVRLAE